LHKIFSLSLSSLNLIYFYCPDPHGAARGGHDDVIIKRQLMEAQTRIERLRAQVNHEKHMREKAEQRMFKNVKGRKKKTRKGESSPKASNTLPPLGNFESQRTGYLQAMLYQMRDSHGVTSQNYNFIL
jgi:hypothetical protein